MRLDGKVIIIIGASDERSMGAATARRLASEGAKLVLGARRLEQLTPIADAIGAEAVACDISREEDLERIAGTALAKHGRIDGAISFAGVNSAAPITEVTRETLQEACDVHLIGTALFIKHMANRMTEGGSIVLTTSQTAYLAPAGLAAYAGTKRGADQIMRIAALELGGQGIRVNSLSPGFTRSGMTEGYFAIPTLEAAFLREIPLKRLPTVEDMANTALWLLSDESRATTGQVIDVSCGQTLRRVPDAEELMGSLNFPGEAAMFTQAEKLRESRPHKAPAVNLRGDPISGERYWTREFMELEWEHMWPRVWHMGARVAQFAEAGDFVTFELGRESILMVRTDKGEIKAFYNVCPHRGNRLVHAEEGSLERFTCAYHSWTFDTEGVLRNVQDPEDFPQGNPCGKLTLNEVACDIWGGFVWFNMDRNAPPLREWLGPLASYLEAWQPENQVRVLWVTVEVPCNWKVIHDNFNESYHLPTLHPELATFIEEDYRQTQFDLYANGHNRMIQMGGLPSLRAPNSSTPQAPLTDMLRFWDLDPDDFEGRPREARLALQQQKRKLGPARGFKHYETMSDDQLTDYNHCTFFPNFSLTFQPDGFQLLRPNPHPTDPEKCLFEHWYMVPEIAGMSEVETPLGMMPIAPGEHQRFKYLECSAGYVADQDLSIVVGQQKGLASRAFTDAYLSEQETRVRRYHEIINDYIEGRR